jgi:beta-glucosidase
VSHWDDVYDTWRVENGEWKVKVGKDAQTFFGSETFTVEHDIEWRGL